MLLLASVVSADGLQLGPYIGFGIGQSMLELDASGLSIELVERTDSAFSGVLGLDLSKRLAVEIALNELDQARLTRDVHVDYRSGHASVLVRGLNDSKSLVQRQGFSVY